MGIVERVFSDRDWRDDLDQELVRKLEKLLKRTKSYEKAYKSADNPAMAQLWVAAAEMFYQMDRMNAKPVDQIRTADRSVEEIARDPIDGQSQADAHNAQAPYRCHVPVAGGLSEPVAPEFGCPPAVPNAPQGWDPVTLLAAADHNALPGVDVLEALLYLADPKARCREIAENALQVFGSVGAVLSAPIPDLITKLGIGRQIACTLKAIHSGMRSVLQEPIRERIRIGSFDELIDYVGLSLKHETVEVLRLLYLDRKNGLISDEEPHRGTVDHVPIYPREIVRRALELGASAVIMAHNHPSGDPSPSQADISFSQHVARALSVVDITLHDSLIVGKNRVASLRSLARL
jgi:DNA repair protein RadC